MKNSYLRILFPSCILVFLSLTAGQLCGSPSLSWEKTQIDLEMEPDQEEIKATFKVMNDGKEQLLITKVKSSCGCTGSALQKESLKPGETTEITATFVKGLRQGLNQNKLDVFINHQKEPISTLSLNVKIPTLIEATPAIIFWAPSKPKEARRISVKLDERYVDQISDIQFENDKLNIAREEDPEGKSNMVLSITPKSYDVFYRGVVTIKATGKDGRKAEVKLLAMVQP